jgi:hypothetical protein
MERVGGRLRDGGGARHRPRSLPLCGVAGAALAEPPNCRTHLGRPKTHLDRGSPGPVSPSNPAPNPNSPKTPKATRPSSSLGLTRTARRTTMVGATAAGAPARGARARAGAVRSGTRAVRVRHEPSPASAHARQAGVEATGFGSGKAKAAERARCLRECQGQPKGRACGAPSPRKQSPAATSGAAPTRFPPLSPSPPRPGPAPSRAASLRLPPTSGARCGRRRRWEGGLTAPPARERTHHPRDSRFWGNKYRPTV